ncbi:MAG: alpha/beta fold hydrolase [Gammaproteobacteria bacterium]|nr:alpha/beta fold hydrolase [Gammaproteobacteria bacterium]
MNHPIVLIHGMWCTQHNFSRMAGLLGARGYKCHMPSLPAHEVGRDDPAVGNLGLKDYLAYLEEYVHQQKFKAPPVLIGHSMGALLAQQLAARIKPFLLVLLTPVAPAGINGIALSNLVAFSRVLTRWGFWKKPHKPGPGRAAASLYNGVPPERHAEIYRSLVPESGRAAFESGFWFLDMARAARVDAAAIRCPVYIVSAGRDQLTPADTVRKVARLYPQSALRHYPDRGHWVIDDEDTEPMTQDIANWIQAQEQRAVRIAVMGRA